MVELYAYTRLWPAATDSDTSPLTAKVTPELGFVDAKVIVGSTRIRNGVSFVALPFGPLIDSRTENSPGVV